MPSQVTIFNADSSPMQLIINRGNPITIAGTNAAQNWMPQSANVPFRMSYPEAGILGVGSNQVEVNIDEMSDQLHIHIPSHIQIFDLQLYLFKPIYNWVLLHNGKVFSVGVQP